MKTKKTWQEKEYEKLKEYDQLVKRQTNAVSHTPPLDYDGDNEVLIEVQRQTIKTIKSIVPWTYKEHLNAGKHIAFVIECDRVFVASVESEEDAAFIVRAVNAHEELVHLLRRIRAFDRQTPLLGTDMVSEIEQAIAKAEGAISNGKKEYVSGCEDCNPYEGK